ncbi:hypothetical protein ACQ4LJ_22130, partial [Huaxiibacter chinensis]
MSMTTNKQTLREEFQYMQAHYSDPADRDRQIVYIDAEALLDELESAERRNSELQSAKPRLPPHKYRDCVDVLQECAIAYVGSQQLRAQLSAALAIFVEPDHPHTRAA